MQGRVRKGVSLWEGLPVLRPGSVRVVGGGCHRVGEASRGQQGRAVSGRASPAIPAGRAAGHGWRGLGGALSASCSHHVLKSQRSFRLQGLDTSCKCAYAAASASPVGNSWVLLNDSWEGRRSGASLCLQLLSQERVLPIRSDQGSVPEQGGGSLFQADGDLEVLGV